MMRRTAIVCAVLGLTALGCGTARADLVIHGRGFGHGIGMSQYGAYGYALKGHRSARWILRHYYPGTRLERTRRHLIRVRLRDARRETVLGASHATDAAGRRLRLHQNRSYTLSVAGTRLAIRDDSAHRTRARLQAPVTISGGRDVYLHGRADNGVSDGAYRGRLVMSIAGPRVLAVNKLDIEHYLYGVITSEMPSGWPFAALKAQAIASRTYALGARRADAPYDVFSDVRSQLYRGIRGESPRAVRAAHSSSRVVVTYRGRFAQTYFFSTSGGRTAAIDQVWEMPALPYLQPVTDHYDYLSPFHRWHVRIGTAAAERRLKHHLRGRLVAVDVTARTRVGRVIGIELVGSDGTTELSGAEFERLLGLRSIWFWVHGP
jgi:stage II sporulation protein D